MKVILQKDIKDQGKKGEMVEVSDGYARNYLLPRKLAVAATADNINIIKQQERARLKQVEKEKAEAAATAEKLESSVVRLFARAGEKGKLFGSVTSKEISEAVAEQLGVTIEKHSIFPSEPIKSFGSFEVKCKLGRETNGVIHLLVTDK